MKKLMMLMAMAVCVMFCVAQEKVIVNDPLAQVRQVSGFSEVVVRGSIDLYLSPDDHETVVVSAKEEQFRDRIVTMVKGNVLEISFNDKGLQRRSDMRLKAYVSFRQMNRVAASGASDVFVNGVIRADRLKIEISGASDFNGAVDVAALELRQSGSSDSKISGRAGLVDVDLSGASDMKAFDLNTEVCRAHASGASDVSITVMKELYVQASGASDVKYKGVGTVKEVRTSGASSVRMMREP